MQKMHRRWRQTQTSHIYHFKQKLSTLFYSYVIFCSCVYVLYLLSQNLLWICTLLLIFTEIDPYHFSRRVYLSVCVYVSLYIFIITSILIGELFHLIFASQQTTLTIIQVKTDFLKNISQRNDFYTIRANTFNQNLHKGSISRAPIFIYLKIILKNYRKRMCCISTGTHNYPTL